MLFAGIVVVLTYIPMVALLWEPKFHTILEPVQQKVCYGSVLAIPIAGFAIARCQNWSLRSVKGSIVAGSLATVWMFICIDFVVRNVLPSNAEIYIRPFFEP